MEQILAYLQSNYDKLLLQEYKVASELWVDVTMINNPGSFYVMPTVCSSFINIFTSTEPAAKVQSVNLHDVVIIKLEEDAPKYVRGKILNTENTESGVKCDVFAIDFGYYVRSVPLENIWQCDDKYMNFPPLAIHCRLANCAPKDSKEWSKSAIDAFKYYVGNDPNTMIILDKTFDQLVVELYNTNPQYISSLLNLNGYTKFGYMLDDLEI